MPVLFKEKVRLVGDLEEDYANAVKMEDCWRRDCHGEEKGGGTSSDRRYVANGQATDVPYDVVQNLPLPQQKRPVHAAWWRPW